MSQQFKACAMLAFLALIPAFPADAGIFNSRLDDFRELVEAGKVEEAAALSAKEAIYFTSLKGDKRRYVDDVLAQRDHRYRAELGEARARLVIAEREEGQIRYWQQLKLALPAAQAVQARVGKLPARGPLVTAGLDAMKSTIDRIGRALMADAPQALLDYGLFTEPAFPTQYPIAVRWTDHPDLAGRVGAQLDKATARQLKAFKTAYGDTLVPAMGVGKKLDELYVAARVRESGASTYLTKRLVRDRLQKDGWPVTNAAGGGVLLAAWPAPKSEISSFRAAAPHSVDYKLLDAAQTPEAFIASGGAGAHELVVFLRSSPIRVQRAESNVRQMNSQYQTGTRRVQNPDHARAVEALREAQDELQQVNQMVANTSSSGDDTLGALAAMVGVASTAATESRVRNAQRALEDTPSLIEEPVFAPYAYSARTLAVKQGLTIHYAVYDAGTGRVSTGSIERVWEKAFQLADGVRADDRSFATSALLKSAKTLQDVDNWISAPVDDKYEDIWAAIFSAYGKQGLGV